jgi:hypothetical protein
MNERILFWVPRIFTIMAILFMMMFSFDVFEGNDPLGQKLVGFLMNSIPVFILIVVLIIAWKWGFTGGLFFIIAFIISCFFFRSFSGNPASLIVTTPFLLTGILFIVHYFLYVKKSVEK